jgi:hypothetical protein
MWTLVRDVDVCLDPIQRYSIEASTGSARPRLAVACSSVLFGVSIGDVALLAFPMRWGETDGAGTYVRKTECGVQRPEPKANALPRRAEDRRAVTNRHEACITFPAISKYTKPAFLYTTCSTLLCLAFLHGCTLSITLCHQVPAFVLSGSRSLYDLY